MTENDSDNSTASELQDLLTLSLISIPTMRVSGNIGDKSTAKEKDTWNYLLKHKKETCILLVTLSTTSFLSDKNYISMWTLCMGWDRAAGQNLSSCTFFLPNPLICQYFSSNPKPQIITFRKVNLIAIVT